MKLLEKGKTTETESRSAVAGVGSRSRYQLRLSRGKFGGDGAVLQLDCRDDCTITHQFIVTISYQKFTNCTLRMGEFLWRRDTSIQLFKEGRGRNCLGIVFL